MPRHRKTYPEAVVRVRHEHTLAEVCCAIGLALVARVADASPDIDDTIHSPGGTNETYDVCHVRAAVNSVCHHVL